MSFAHTDLPVPEYWGDSSFTHTSLISFSASWNPSELSARSLGVPCSLFTPWGHQQGFGWRQHHTTHTHLKVKSLFKCNCPQNLGGDRGCQHVNIPCVSILGAVLLPAGKHPPAKQGCQLIAREHLPAATAGRGKVRNPAGTEHPERQGQGWRRGILQSLSRNSAVTEHGMWA